MFLTIYTIYKDSLIFVRENPFVLLPYVLYDILNFFVGKWVPGDLIYRGLYFVFMMLCFCLVETFMIVVVYKRETVIKSPESIWQIFNKYYGQAILLFVYGGLIVFLLGFIPALFGIPFEGLLSDILIVLIFLGANQIGLRHSIFYDNHLVMGSIKAGLKDLLNNFFFYLPILLFGVVILNIPSVISPSSWVIFPYLPIAEFYYSFQQGEVTWFRMLLNPILSSVTSIALTYTFLLKNKKTKNAS